MNTRLIQGITFDEYAKLVAIYSDPTRHYHNINHIYRSFGILNEFKDSGTPTDADFDLVSRAIWFHDSYYSPYSFKGENEELSATLALADDYKYNSVLEEIILATAKHTQDQDFTNEESPWEDSFRISSIQLMLDVDTAGMGGTQKDFVQDSHKIRKEYSYVSEKDFLEGRLGFFKKMRDRKQIYYTPYFFDKYEEKCRDNLEFGIWEIQEELKDPRFLPSVRVS